MTDILLLNLPMTSLGYKTLGEFASRSFPLGLGSLSGTLKRSGFSFKVLDADAINMSMDDMISAVLAERPRIIGMSTYTAYADMAKYAVKEIKSALKDCVVVLGGHHAFQARGELLKETPADIIAIGEGEVTFQEICDAVLKDGPLDDIKGIYFNRNGEAHYTGDRDFARNLDDLPMPAYEYFPMDAYHGHFYRKWTSGHRKPFANIITSRGCPFRCGFCSNVMWGKSVRFQSPERVMREIDHLVKNYRIRQMTFFDDTFTLDMTRAHKICDMLIERDYGLDIQCSTRVDSLDEDLVKKMARSGFTWFSIGIESGNDRILKKIQKGQAVTRCSEVLRSIAENSMAVYGNIILGYPEEDKRTMKDSLSFILNNPVHLPQFNIFVPYPGTPIYEELVAKGVEIPKNVNQYTDIISYNRSISAKYLHFFLWYSYFRSLVSIRYFNLVRKIFKLSIVVSDILKIAWALVTLNRERERIG